MAATRRAVLQGVGAAALVGGGVEGCAEPTPDGDSDLPRGCVEPAGDGAPAEPVDRDRFAHGVASGDPFPDSVVLWTRVSGATGPTPVAWRVATSASLGPDTVVAEGTFVTDAERDFTVKVSPSGLAPDTTYFYVFVVDGRRSPMGRTRTAPIAPIAPPARLRFAVCSCANYARGFFNAYGRIAARADLAFVVHLGDYLYEYSESGFYRGGDETKPRVRATEPQRELVTLDDYRARYAQYRTDRDLQEVHRQHPFIAVWDDHEIANNAWRDGAENHDDREGSFEARKLAAVQAYVEWMPIRTPDPADPIRIWRSFAFGGLVDLFMLDTRLYGRDRQLDGVRERVPATDPELNDPSRQLLGAAQEAWLLDGLRRSTASWTLLGNQLPFGQHKVTAGANADGGGRAKDGDKWDGYAAQRGRILDVVEQTPVGDLVVLTGDIHVAAAQELTRDPDDPEHYDPATGRGSLGVEFICTSVTSGGSQPEEGHQVDDALFAITLAGPNTHMKMVDSRRGYLLVDVDEDRLVGEYWAVDTVLDRSDVEVFRHGFHVARGSRFLGEDQPEPVPPLDCAPGLAPE